MANPEALVARTNLQREASLAPDTRYLASGLSDDAVPTIAALLPRLEPAARADALAQLCTDDGAARRFVGWAAWNRSRAEADRQRAALCDR